MLNLFVVTEGIIENNYKEWPSLMGSEYHEPSKEMDLVCCFSLHIIPHVLLCHCQARHGMQVAYYTTMAFAWKNISFPSHQ